jgi:hypothetical protein
MSGTNILKRNRTISSSKDNPGQGGKYEVISRTDSQELNRHTASLAGSSKAKQEDQELNKPRS